MADFGFYSWEDPAAPVPPQEVARFGTRQRLSFAARDRPVTTSRLVGLIVGPNGQLTDDSPRHDTPLLVNVDTGAVVEGHKLRQE